MEHMPETDDVEAFDRVATRRAQALDAASEMVRTMDGAAEMDLAARLRMILDVARFLLDGNV